jgi:hypothetical protein
MNRGTDGELSELANVDTGQHSDAGREGRIGRYSSSKRTRLRVSRNPPNSDANLANRVQGILRRAD